MRLNSFILILGCFFSLSECVEKVIRAYIPRESVEWFNQFVNNQSEVDIWLSTRLNNQYFNSSSNNIKKYKYIAEFKVSDYEIINKKMNDFEKHKVLLNVLINDLNRYISDRNQRTRRSNVVDRRVVGRYASHNDITSWMIQLQKKHPKLVQVYRIGKTFENRPIMVLRMTNQLKSKELKPLFLYDGGIHAREWLSIATCVYLIDKLLNKYLESDELITKIFNKFELHFLPVLNPDGYEYSRSSKFNRYWRKNMRYTRFNSKDYACYGVDLNRNFDYKWMVAGASANPCSEVFSGPYPASEPEVKSLMRYIMNKSPRWVSHISLHSYGAIWLSPFSYSKTHIQENFEETCQKATLAIRKIEKTHKFKFRFGSASHELYEASGCSEDWAKEVAKINHTFVIELKPEKSDTPEAGFDHPENKLEETALEMYDGFVEYMKSFLVDIVDDSIKQECKTKLEDMKREIEGYEEEENYDF